MTSKPSPLSISICLPTRGRPERLLEMMNSALRSAKNPSSIDFIIYVDDDDYSMSNLEFPQTHKISGPRLSVSEMTNICFNRSSGDVLMYAADDVLFRTVYWDCLIKEAITSSESQYWLIYGDDLGQTSNKIATHGFVSRELAELLGYLLPPYFSAEFCDTWLTSITRLSGTQIKLSNLVIEHMHPDWNKAALDTTYLERDFKLNFPLLWLKYTAFLPLRVIEATKIYFYKRLDAAKK